MASGSWLSGVFSQGFDIHSGMWNLFLFCSPVFPPTTFFSLRILFNYLALTYFSLGFSNLQQSLFILGFL
jgi:hypothetical protein